MFLSNCFACFLLSLSGLSGDVAFAGGSLRVSFLTGSFSDAALDASSCSSLLSLAPLVPAARFLCFGFLSRSRLRSFSFCFSFLSLASRLLLRSFSFLAFLSRPFFFVLVFSYAKRTPTSMERRNPR